MRVHELTVEVRDVNLNRIGIIDDEDITDLKLIKRYNNVGSWSFSLGAEHPMTVVLSQPGAGILVTGPNSRVMMSGPMVSATKKEATNDTLGTWFFIGSDDMIHLADARAFPKPSEPDVTAQDVAHDVRSGNGETVIKQYVYNNIGGGAPLDRQIPTLAIGPNLTRGATVIGRARFNKLGELLGKLATTAGLGFDISQSGTDKVFDCYVPNDKSSLIRMDIENDLLDEAEYGFGAPTATRVIVGGQGQQELRTFIEVESTDSAPSESAWGRKIEYFHDLRSTAEIDELTQAGAEIVVPGAVMVTALNVKPSDEVTMVYGRDWYLGDKISVTVDGQELKAIVTEAIISVDATGVRVAATIGEPTGFDFESRLASTQVQQGARISALERTVESGLIWNSTDGTYEFQLGGGNVTLQIGQEQVIKVNNNTGALLPNGAVVYPTGSTGANKLVAKAQANAEATSSNTFGVLTEDIANGGHGFVTTFGLVHDIDTSALTEGAAVWLSPTVAGGLTSTKPSAPSHMVLVGFCIRSHAVNGVLFVKVQNGFELNEIHDVMITAPVANDIVVRNAGNTGWENKTLAATGISQVGHTHDAAAIVSGTLPVARGGTGAATLTGYVKGTGTTAFTAAATVPGADVSGNITGNAANVTGTVAAGNGGTGQTSYAIGDLLYAPTAATVGKLADITTGNALLSGGVGVAPAYGKVGLTTHVSGTLAVANGGTGAVTLNSGGYLKGAGTGAITAQSGIPATDITSGALDIARGGTGVTTGAGLVPIIPTSVSNTGGTSSYSTTTGKITLTGASTALVFDGVFTSAYTNYRIVFNPTSGGDYLYIRSVNAGTVNSTAGAYAWQMLGVQSGVIYYGSTYFSTSDTGMKTSALSTINASFSFDVMAPYISTLTTRIHGQGNWAVNQPTIWTYMGNMQSASTTTGLQIFPASGNFSGTLSIYGYKD